MASNRIVSPRSVRISTMNCTMLAKRGRTSTSSRACSHLRFHAHHRLDRQTVMGIVNGAVDIFEFVEFH
jgi:hypothetical protein